MGMFDTLTWKRTEPGDPPTGVEYQTKSLYCDLSGFEMREDGSLWRLATDLSLSWDDIEELDIGKRPEGWVEPPPLEWERCDLTGSVCFYGGEEKPQRYYVALFVEGRVRWVKPTTESEYYTPRAAQDYAIELIEAVLKREEPLTPEETEALKMVVTILKAC